MKTYDKLRHYYEIKDESFYIPDESTITASRKMTSENMTRTEKTKSKIKQVFRYLGYAGIAACLALVLAAAVISNIEPTVENGFEKSHGETLGNIDHISFWNVTGETVDLYSAADDFIRLYNASEFVETDGTQTDDRCEILMNDRVNNVSYGARVRLVDGSTLSIERHEDLKDTFAVWKIDGRNKILTHFYMKNPELDSFILMFFEHYTKTME